MWYPWANQLIIDGKINMISDEVNVVLYEIYERNCFYNGKPTRKHNFPQGPYEIEEITIRLKGKLVEVIMGIKYMGIHRLSKTTKKKVRKLIEKDRANAKEWLKFEQSEREKLKEQNSVVGGVTRIGVKNSVKIWEKLTGNHCTGL